MDLVQSISLSKQRGFEFFSWIVPEGKRSPVPVPAQVDQCLSIRGEVAGNGPDWPRCLSGPAWSRHTGGYGQSGSGRGRVASGRHGRARPTEKGQPLQAARDVAAEVLEFVRRMWNRLRSFIRAHCSKLCAVCLPIGCVPRFHGFPFGL